MESDRIYQPSHRYALSQRSGERNLAPIFGVSRLRMGTDGNGITTLVAFKGCPLHCKYCLNPQCHLPIRDVPGARFHTPKSLYRLVAKDNIYFQYTGGGICFGGGEPAMYPEFIKAFRELCGDRWKITLETSLHVPWENIEMLIPVVDHWIVDIKDLNPDIDKAYTGIDGDIHGNILMLKSECRSHITVKVPHIPGYNDHFDVELSIEFLQAAGFEDIKEFTYIIPDKKINTSKI